MKQKRNSSYPWHRAGNYFGLETFLSANDLIGAKWTKLEQDKDGDGVSDIVTTRFRDSNDRTIKLTIDHALDPNSNVQIELAYDESGRVIRLSIQRAKRPSVINYKFDLRDRLIEETRTVEVSTGSQKTSVASHRFDKKSNIKATLVVSDQGLIREKRTYNSSGELTRLLSYDDQQNLFLDEDSRFDGFHRLRVREAKQFVFDSESNATRTSSLKTEKNFYRGKSTHRDRQEIIEFQEFENPANSFTLYKSSEETTQFAPRSGGTQVSLFRMWQPVPSGEPVEVLQIEKRIEVDSLRRTVGWTETNKNLETGEVKTSRSKTRFLKMYIEEVDTNGDGQMESEAVTIVDERDVVIESKEGDPNGGPFRHRQQVLYDFDGKITKRLIFKDNATTPSSVDTFVYE